jgi:hypothetical protein
MKKEKYDYLARSASSTDCTGLMPTPASTEAEREAYQSLYHYMPTEINEDIDDKE